MSEHGNAGALCEVPRAIVVSIDSPGGPVGGLADASKLFNPDQTRQLMRGLGMRQPSYLSAFRCLMSSPSVEWWALREVGKALARKHGRSKNRGSRRGAGGRLRKLGRV